MSKTVSQPKLFVVKGRTVGMRVTQKIDTCRDVGVSPSLRVFTKREIVRSDSFCHDTARIVHNMHNIQFDTARLTKQNVCTINDTFRKVNSKLPVYDYSLYVHSTTGTPIECVVFHNTDLFPIKDKYLHVVLDGTGEDGYLPLAQVGSEYDSGLRYTEDDGTVWQICTNLVFNLFDEYLTADNYFINTFNIDYVYKAFKAIFAGRVSFGNNCIYLLTPQTECGVTKMLMIGCDLRISWTKEGSNDYNNGITLSTYYDGVNDTSYGGDNKYKANAMLVKFEPRKKYRIQFFDSRKSTAYTKDEIIKGCFIVGKDVEKLPEESSKYTAIAETNSWCTCDKKSNSIVSACNYEDEEYYDYAQELKTKWLNYPHSTLQYQYYDLANLEYKELRDDD